jgi:5-methylcytosine-specific restriction protein A
VVTVGSRCLAHQREQFRQKTQQAMEDPRKAEDKRFYDSALWQKLRAQVLMKEPYCRECRRNGRVELATMVDHIHRIQDGGSRLAASNLQPLCEHHHAVKRQKESQEAKRV